MGMTTAADWAAKRRHLETITLDNVVVDAEDGWVHLRHGSWGFALKITDCESIPIEGDDYELETIGTTPTGLRGANGWLMHKTDQQLADEHNQFIRDIEERRQAELAENREKWTEQEAALPEWLRDRLARFRANGGEQFDVDGWAYELFICRLAAVFESDGEQAAEQFASDEGSTGNQWGCAKALAAAHAAEEDMTQFPAGATPITGDPYFRGRGVKTP